MAREPKIKPESGTSATETESEDPILSAGETESGDPAGAPADASPPVEDEELLQMLEHLSKTIDTAHSVLDEQHRMVMEATQPPMPHLPVVEPVRSVAEPADSRSGPVVAMLTAAASAMLGIGALGAWWLFMNQPNSSARHDAAKDEARIAGSDVAGGQDAGLPPNPEPPLPKKNPARRIVAGLAAVPVHQQPPAPSSDSENRQVKAIDRTVNEPFRVREKAPEKTTRPPSRSVQIPPPVAPQPQATLQVPAKPEPRSVAQPQPRRQAREQAATAASPAVAPQQRAAAPVQPTPPPRQETRDTASVQTAPATPPRPAQTKPQQLARVAPQGPTAAEKTAPRKKTPPPLSGDQEKRILDRGASLAQLGDIAGARLVLEYAALRGSGQAMFALGQTYDPEYLSARGVIGVAPDIKAALKWYRGALSLGMDAATARVRALEAQYGQMR